MIKKLFILFFFVINSAWHFSQTHFYYVTFLVYTNAVNKNESVFITGNDSLLGNWNPADIQLDKINDSTWSKKIHFKSSTSLEYKFTLGSWSTEALNEDSSIPKNFKVNVTNDTIIVHLIHRWKNPQLSASFGQITGTIKYHRNFIGDGIKPRDIVIWLPPSYEEEAEKYYPVLYMNDGQNIFDPATSSFGYDWQIDEISDSLIKIGKLKEIIIVAVYNSVDRSLEYSHTSLGYAYMDFLVTQLKPFIDSTYRTLTQSKYNAVGGASLGGLISFMLVWNYPEVFSMGACLSSAFKIGNINYVDTVLNYSGEKKHIKLYIDIGGVEVEKELRSGNDQMIRALKKQDYKSNYDFIYTIDVSAEHSEKAWARRIWQPLLFFFGK